LLLSTEALRGKRIGNPERTRTLADNGKEKLVSGFDWNGLPKQLHELMAATRT
jgi:hypothetical protein